jgi:hypothetical protein
MKLIITWGLPGSGKTNFTNEQIMINRRNHNGCRLYTISHDECGRYGNDKTKNFISKMNSHLNSSVDILIADTLITTHDDLSNFLKQLNLKKVISIDIQYWCEDRESCLWNDRYRRSDNSNITILNAPLEVPDTATIKSFCPNIRITIIYNNVMRKENWQVFSDKYKIRHTDGIVKSDSWSLGGTYGNCWDDTKHQVSGEPQPASFSEFDDLLESACPSIGFLQYKKLYNACMTTDTRGESDYYGGHIEYGFYKFKVEELFDKLIELDIITEDEL